MHARQSIFVFGFVLAAGLSGIGCVEGLIRDFPLCDEEDPQLIQCGEEGEEVCVDLRSDPAHCGACHNACDASETCEDGFCSMDIPAVCDDPLVLCGDACVDTMINDAHCGACDQACDAKASCSEGVCEPNDVSCTEETAELVCAEGEICIEGFCAKDPGPKGGDVGDKCFESHECKDDLVCHEGLCTKVDEPECSSDDDCTEEGEICDDESKLCREGCRTSDDCPPGASCVPDVFLCMDM